MTKLTYNTCEAAKALNIGMNKMYELLKNNDIHHIKIGRKTIIPKRELHKWLKKASNN